MSDGIRLRLVTVKIDRYRSVKTGRMDEMGDYNLLIGQNNVGKSNILRAVADSLHFLSLEQSIREVPLDETQNLFFDNEWDKSISIRLSFSGWQRSRSSKTAGPQLHVGVKVTRFEGRRPYWWLSNIALGQEPEEGSQGREDLYTCSPSSAEEMLSLIKERNQLAEEQRFVKELGTSLNRQGIPAGQAVNEYAAKVRSLREGEYPIFDSFLRGVWSGTINQSDVPTLHTKYATQVDDAIAENRLQIDQRIKSFVPERSRENYANARAAIARIKTYRSKENPEPLTASDREFLFNLSTSFDDQRRWKTFADTISRFLNCEIRPLRDQGGLAVIQLDRFLDIANGSGIRGALRLLVDLEATQPTIAFLEEPELHLHPTLARTLAAYLRQASQTTQLFLASHSAEFVDSDEPDNYIYLTTYREGSSHVRGMKTRNAVLPIIDEIGLVPSSILMYDRLVLVEGDSDERILRSFAQTLGREGGLAGVGFLHIRGSSAFSHYAAQEVVSFLNRRKVRVWAVLDRDETTQEEINRLNEKFKEFPKSKLVVWSRREIENFLLVPAAIARDINRRRQSMNRQSVSENEIKEALASLRGEARAELIRLRLRKKLLKPVYFGKELCTDQIREELIRKSAELTQSANDYDEVNASVASEVDAIEEGRLFEIAPGGFLLDKLYEKYECHYDKSDGATVAGAISERQISREVVDLINELASL